LYHLAHFSFAFVLLMGVWPSFVFARTSDDAWERRWACYLRIVLIYIVVGYLLVALKLFEVLSILVVLLALTFRHYLTRGSDEARVTAMTLIGKNFYDLLDMGFRLKTSLQRMKNWEQLRSWDKYKIPSFPKSSGLWVKLTLACVLLGAIYIRFYDACVNAAPALSDGYVTLAWMKYINRRLLFEDGIYPQGFHIVLAYLHKFSAIDQLYVLKYTGPLNGVLFTFGLYFVLSRLTGNRFAGMMAAAVYGLAGEALLVIEWLRQASTNSQEFAIVFLFPSLYFMFLYLKNGKRADLLTAAAGCCVTGLVHSLVFAYLGMGMGILLFVAMILHFSEYWSRVWRLALAGIASVLVSLAPITAGLLAGKKFHGSSEEFLHQTVEVASPILHAWDYIALSAIFITLLAVFFTKRKEERLFPLFAGLLGLCTFLIYYYGGVLTNSLLLSTRSISLWAAAVPFCIGAAWDVLWKVLHKIPRRQAAEWSICTAAVASLVFSTGLEPIKPYKMEWDSSVEQYLRIASTFRPKTWIIYSQNEGYALALGNGYHGYLRELLDTYDPKHTPLTKKGEEASDPFVPVDIFIYQEKNVFQVEKTNNIYQLLAETYEQRKQENAALKQWIDTYRAYHNDLEIFYEDENLRIYHLHRPDDPEKNLVKIWGRS